MYDLTRRLGSQGWDVTVACDPACEVFRAGVPAGVGLAPFVTVRTPSVRDARALDQLADVVRRTRPALIHAHSSKAGLLAGVVGRAFRVPTLYTPHGWSFQMQGSSALRATFAATERLLARHAHRRIVAVCASERDEALHRRVAQPDQIVVVHTGRESAEVPITRSEARARLGLGPSDHRTVVAWIGRVGRQKGSDGLPQLALRLAEADVALAVLGSGLIESGVAAAVTAAGGIAVPSSISPHVLLGASDILVSTSAWEGLPLVVLEAMEHSLPVVAYDVGGLREQVVEGLNGHLVPGEAADVLASRVAAISRSPERMRRFGRASHHIWSQRFRPETMVDRVELVYADVLARAYAGSAPCAARRRASRSSSRPVA